MITTMANPISTVLVVGEGSAGLLAALALKTRFPELDVRILAYTKADHWRWRVDDRLDSFFPARESRARAAPLSSSRLPYLESWLAVQTVGNGSHELI